MTNLLCFSAGSVVNVSQLPSRRQGDFTITPMVLDNSITVFGMSAVLVNPDGISDDWSCSIFLLGKNNDIVAATQPVRSVFVQPFILEYNTDHILVTLLLWEYFSYSYVPHMSIHT